MMSCTMIYGIYFMGSVKSAVGDNLNDDSFTSMIASVSSFMGVFRFIWSVGLNKYSFKKVYGFLVTTQIILAFMTPVLLDMGSKTEYISMKKATYSISLMLATVMQGGHYVLYPSILN